MQTGNKEKNTLKNQPNDLREAQQQDTVHRDAKRLVGLVHMKAKNDHFDIRKHIFSILVTFSVCSIFISDKLRISSSSH